MTDPALTGTSQRASYADRIAMRRELVLLTVERLPGLTAGEIGEELRDVGAHTIVVLNDLKRHLAAGRVRRVIISARRHVWFYVPPPAMPLLWEGDQA